MPARALRPRSRRFLPLRPGPEGAIVHPTRASRGGGKNQWWGAEGPLMHFRSDGVALSPIEYARLLTRLAEDGGIVADEFSREGVVATLEERMATMLGKEMAVFMPRGALANNLALRLLAQRGRRVLVQRESHIYNDAGDCTQELSGLTLIPLAPERATFTLAEESGIGLHLDGARLFLASAYTGIAPARYAALFDTVYVSLYKYFNAASGAVLAGPRQLLENLYHQRRMFGGGLRQAWPFAAVALHYLDGFSERFQRATAAADNLFQALQNLPNCEIPRSPAATNVARLFVSGRA